MSSVYTDEVEWIVMYTLLILIPKYAREAASGGSSVYTRILLESKYGFLILDI